MPEIRLDSFQRERAASFSSLCAFFKSDKEALAALKLISLLDPLRASDCEISIHPLEESTYALVCGIPLALFKIEGDLCGILVHQAFLSHTPACAIPYTSKDMPQGDQLVFVHSLDEISLLQSCLQKTFDLLADGNQEILQSWLPDDQKDKPKRADTLLHIKVDEALFILSEQSEKAQALSFCLPAFASNPSAEPFDPAKNSHPLSVMSLYIPFLMYAFIQNNLPSFDRICLCNTSLQPLRALRLHIHSDGGHLADIDLDLPDLGCADQLSILSLALKPANSILLEISEPLDDEIELQVLSENQILYAKKLPLRLLPFDQWCGTSIEPTILAAYCLPSHPAISMLMQQTSRILKTWNEDPSLEGYQSDSPDRVRILAAAAYAALQQQNIAYAMPPASFGFLGQRIRLPDAILDEHMGTCLDLTILYASLLEAIGLHPILILLESHAFCGVWLEENVFEHSLITDGSLLEKLCEPGVTKIAAIETTSVCAGKSRSFEDACLSGQSHLHRYGDFEFALDVRRLRLEGIRPLPVRTKAGGSYVIEHEERSDEELTERPEELGERIDFSTLSVSDEPVSRMSLWQRKLVDLSLRNSLISLRFHSACIPLLSTDLAALEDALYDSAAFTLTPSILEGVESSALEFVSPEFFKAIKPLRKLLDLELKGRRLPTLLSAAQLNRSLTALYRTSRSAMEENGSNTLFLALGLLRFFAPSEKTPRYAPLILIPVELKRKAGGRRFGLVMRDEDSQINITLLEYLRQTFALKIPGLNPPPLDAHGLDVDKIFALIRHAILPMEYFSVIDAACLGTFSFARFPMYNDIRTQSDALMKSPIVASLSSGALIDTPPLPDLDDDSIMDDLILAAPLDGSQRKALAMAECGCDFVLHGPPGTGKSQTITAMIADLLGKGQTVLFAAEKMAALDVVQKRLEAMGLSRFVLELHSAKASRKAVLARMKEALEKAPPLPDTSIDAKLEETRELAASLERYASALHKEQNCGRSLAELIADYQSLDSSLEEIRIDPQKALTFTSRQISRQLDGAERLEVLLQDVPSLCGSPLLRVKASLYTSRHEDELSDALKDSITALKALVEADGRMHELYQFPLLHTMNDFLQCRELGEFSQTLSGMPAWQLENSPLKRRRQYEQIKAQLEMENRKKQLRENLQSRWNEAVLHVRVEDLKKQYLDAGSRFVGRRKAMKAVIDLLGAYARFEIREDNFLPCLLEIETFQRELLPAQNPSALLPVDASDLEALARQIERCETFWRDYGNLLGILRIDLSDLSTFKQDTLAFSSVCQSFDAAFGRVFSLLDPHFEPNAPDFTQSYQSFVCGLLDNLDGLKDWMRLRHSLDALESLGMDELIEACLQKTLRKNLRAIWEKSLARTIIRTLIDQDPVLQTFAGSRFEKMIEQFARLDEQRIKLSARQIELRLTRNLPSDQESPAISAQLNILRKALANGGRGLSLRTLFSQIPDIFRRFFPCLLMSPVSASQFLDFSLPCSDVALFDEASQMQTCAAVGLLARAKHAIICGDPNQMPPTSFFSSVHLDEEHADLEDLDSILDDALALGLPSLHLDWHYRSRHESLIAFSNREFYENRMLTFPSADFNARRIRCVQTGGIFERGKSRTNPQEARALVDYILALCHAQSALPADDKQNRQSVGVVTFNIPQQTLIEDLLAKEAAKDRAFDAWMSEGKEPLFVKNLENVQGDERDIILFSFTYGPDENGKISMNFGPINRDNGWKRLNVAITRARRQMVVFCSLNFDQIDTRRTNSRGVQALHDFLAYASQNAGEQKQLQSAKNDSTLASIVQARLQNAGIAADLQVGMSSQRVDIGIRNPHHPDTYCAGILFDASKTNSHKNVRDREIGTPSVLEGLGWTIIRFWSIDWWNNEERAWNALYARVLDALAHAPEGEPFPVCELSLETSGETGMPASDKESDTAQDDPEGICKTQSEPPVQEADADFDPNAAVQYPGDMLSAAQTKETTEPDAFISKDAVSLVQADSALPAMQASADKMQFANRDSLAEPTDDLQSSLASLLPRQTPPDPQCMEYERYEQSHSPMNTSEFTDPKNKNALQNTLLEILEIESPISIDLLKKRLLRSYGISRTSNLIDPVFNTLLRQSGVCVIEQGRTRIVWKPSHHPANYCLYRKESDPSSRRSPDQICQEEYCALLGILCKEDPSLSGEALLRAAAKRMGYARVSALLRECISRGMALYDSQNRKSDL